MTKTCSENASQLLQTLPTVTLMGGTGGAESSTDSSRSGLGSDTFIFGVSTTPDDDDDDSPCCPAAAVLSALAILT